ncbi:MAG: TadE family type IV pilus minor pilin [Candidatus Nanopelagicales bacterium]
MAVETALSLVALVAVVGMLLFGVGLLGAQLAVGEAARSAARAAARGEPGPVVVDEARRVASDADVVVEHAGDRVLVRVERAVTPPGVLARLGPIRLSAAATAGLEPGAAP